MKYEDKETIKMFANPMYAIHIHPDLFKDHDLIVPEETWIQANLQMMDKVGNEAWLREHVNVLKTGRSSETNEQTK